MRWKAIFLFIIIIIIINFLELIETYHQNHDEMLKLSYDHSSTALKSKFFHAQGICKTGTISPCPDWKQQWMMKA